MLSLVVTLDGQDAHGLKLGPFDSGDPTEVSSHVHFRRYLPLGTMLRLPKLAGFQGFFCVRLAQLQRSLRLD
jgi:hypothetical protein